MKMRSLLQTSLQLVFLGILCTSVQSLSAQIMAGTKDDFEDLTPGGWMEGAPSPDQPFVVNSGGPAGADDAFLRNTSSGAAGPGGKWVIFNRTSRWNGNYTAANITTILMDVRNSGSTPVNLRIAFSGSGGAIASSQVHVIPPDNVWRSVSYDINPAAFVGVLGGNPTTTLAATTEFRILSAATPTNIGDQIQASVDVDNILAETLMDVTRVDRNPWSFTWQPDQRILSILPDSPGGPYLIEIVNILGQSLFRREVLPLTEISLPDNINGLNFIYIHGLGTKPAVF